MSKVQQWLESGKYLPKFLRDYHDQKDIFKCFSEGVELHLEEHGGFPMKNLTWLDAHIYTIDIFLWIMARHGYTLQRSRKDLPFSDLDETVSLSKKARSEASARSIQNIFQKKDPT